MKRFSCGDVVPNCKARFDAATEADLLAQIANHARNDHGMSSLPDSLVQEVKRHIIEYDGSNG